MTKQDEPTISVVIPARNAAETLGEQLEALCAQDADEHFEVIVVVNGCTDDTEAVARGYQGRLDLRTIESAPGYSSARNAGALAARSNIVLFCDADDAACRDWVREMGSAVRKRHGIVGGLLKYDRFNTPELLEINDVTEPKPEEVRSMPVTDDFDDQRSVTGSNFGVWRDEYLTVSGMDNSYVGGLEETDFCYRARRRGIPVTFSSRGRVQYRLRAQPGTAFRQQRGYAVNKVLFAVRTAEPLEGAVIDLPYSFNLSFKWSFLQLARYGALAITLPFHDETRRIKILHHLGGHLGSVEGHLKYRLLKQVPDRELLG